MRGAGLLVLAPLALTLACGGGQGSAPAIQVISVTLSPSGASVWTGGTQAFQATVSGTANQAVAWSVVESSGGSISAAGLYTAPGAAGSFHVKATSAADATKSAQASVTVSVQPPAGACNGASTGVGASLNGFTCFPSDNPWNRDVSGDPVDPNSAAIISFIGAGIGLHPDFGSGLWQGAPSGIPYTVVASPSQAKVPVTFTAYGSESDPGPMPIPASAPVEGGNASSGDRHVLVMDRDTCVLYELYNARLQGNGSWTADSTAIWDLKSNALRPYGWTSADAAGLPIFPGLARYDEVAAGAITHALRFTVNSTRAAFVPPASHWAPYNPATYSAPMGMRVRLKASYVIPASFSTETRALLTAMKTYGLIVADNGSNWYVSGAPDERWNNDKLVSELAQVKGSNFEVVRMDGLVVAP